MRLGGFIAAIALSSAVAVCGCSNRSAPETGSDAGEAGWRIAPDGDLSSFFACLRKAGVTLVSAHRGGPADGYPENAIETFAHTLSFAPALLEIDVAETSDGVLYLLHDERLERTTTGEGEAAGLDWNEIKDLRLEDLGGDKTRFTPTRFDEALAWAKGRAILEVDIKPSASYEAVVKAIINHHAKNRIVLIAPSLAAAQKLERLLPGAMISVPADSISDLNRAVAADIAVDHILAFTADEETAPRVLSAFQEQGAVTIFATLGGRDSLDRKIALAGENDRYAAFAKAGADIIATDRPVAAAAGLSAAGRGAKDGVCGVTKLKASGA